MGRVVAGAASDTGKVREHNEDVVRLSPPDAPEAVTAGFLAAVADGMGGHERGEVASQLAVEALFATFYADGHPEGVGTTLRRAFKAANERIVAEAATSSGGRGMGTTLVAAAIVGDELTVANVGDSRAYLLRAESATQITRDHSLVEQQVQEGVITPQEARHSRFRNVVTQALGQPGKFEADLYEIVLLPDDRIILCSDGVHGHVEPEEFAELGLRDAPQGAARALIDLAMERGSTDNVSAAVIWYEPARVAAGDGAPDRELVGAGRGGFSPLLLLLLLVLLVAAIAVAIYFLVLPRV